MNAAITSAQSRVLEQLARATAPQLELGVSPAGGAGPAWRTLYEISRDTKRSLIVTRRHLDSLVAAGVVERKLDKAQFYWRVVPSIPLLETSATTAAGAP